MLTREQWEDAARFAGVEIGFAPYQATHPYTPDYYQPSGRVWRPDTDKADFFDVWVKLERWAFSIVDGCEPTSNELAVLWSKFDTAKIDGTDEELMHAGLLLAAAIGATMREEGK